MPTPDSLTSRDRTSTDASPPPLEQAAAANPSKHPFSLIHMLREARSEWEVTNDAAMPRARHPRLLFRRIGTPTSSARGGTQASSS